VARLPTKSNHTTLETQILLCKRMKVKNLFSLHPKRKKKVTSAKKIRSILEDSDTKMLYGLKFGRDLLFEQHYPFILRPYGENTCI
jgi:hypothetical protein